MKNLLDTYRLRAGRFIETKDKIDLEALIPIFHSWLQKDQLVAIKDHVWIDVANYAHLHNGSVQIIGVEGHLFFAQTDAGACFSYRRKRPHAGTFGARLGEALVAVDHAVSLLESDDRFPHKFVTKKTEVAFDDRLLAPTTENAAVPEREDTRGHPGTCRTRLDACFHNP